MPRRAVGLSLDPDGSVCRSGECCSCRRGPVYRLHPLAGVWSVRLTVRPSVRQVSRSLGGSVGRSVGWMDGCLVAWLAGWLAGWSVGRSVGPMGKQVTVYLSIQSTLGDA